MSDIDDLLSAWHRSQTRHGHLNEEVLLELESHLLEEMENLSTLPLSLEEAFLVASHRLGSPEMIISEFSKNDPPVVASSTDHLPTQHPYGIVCPAFSRRFMAALFDFCILFYTWMMLLLSLGSRSIIWLSVTFLLLQLFSILYFVIPTFLWGGTPGKLMAEIKVTHLRGGSISLTQALLRSLPHLLFAAFAVPLTIQPLHLAQTATLMGESSVLSIEVFSQNIGFLFHPALMLTSMAWMVFSIVILLKNPQHRAPHDFLAGTIVLIPAHLPDKKKYSPMPCFQP